MYANKALTVDSSKVEPGTSSWKSPSNIALIKYWGKHGNQLPQNPSISFTLNNAFTETSISHSPKTSNLDAISFDFYFEGARMDSFKPKIEKFLNAVVDIFPFIKQLHLKIESKNSFPHSAGIASSASAMSAMALCLCSIEETLFGQKLSEEEFLRKASYVSRLGSGSACRSVYPLAAVWGKSLHVDKSDDEFAIPFADKLHPIFKDLHNDILIVSKEEKGVSSSQGHALMENNIYAENRYKQANLRLGRLLEALKSGDLETFGSIVESEALTLHAMMMASYKPFILMKPNTLVIIDLIKEFRKESKIPLYFSLDAGPNPHLMYPASANTEVKGFINDILADFCKDRFWIADRIGEGPLKIS